MERKSSTLPELSSVSFTGLHVTATGLQQIAFNRGPGMLCSHINWAAVCLSFMICSCAEVEIREKQTRHIRGVECLSVQSNAGRGWILHPAVCHLTHTAPLPCVAGNSEPSPQNNGRISQPQCFHQSSKKHWPQIHAPWYSL